MAKKYPAKRRRPTENPLEEIFERLGKLETTEDVKYLDQQILTGTRSRVAKCEERLKAVEDKVELQTGLQEENAKNLAELLRLFAQTNKILRRSCFARLFGG